MAGIKDNLVCYDFSDIFCFNDSNRHITLWSKRSDNSMGSSVCHSWVSSLRLAGNACWHNYKEHRVCRSYRQHNYISHDVPIRNVLSTQYNASWLARIAHIFPLYYIIDGLTATMVYDNLRSALIDLSIIALICLMLSIAAVKAFKWREE